MCADLNDDDHIIARTYLERFKSTHFFHVLVDKWENYDYNPVRERESNRANEAERWYRSVTTKPVSIGKRVASALRQCGVDATYEKTITSPYGTVRADIFALRNQSEKPNVIIELKVYAPENTMPSSIKDAIKVTLKRHAQFAGFLQRQ